MEIVLLAGSSPRGCPCKRSNQRQYDCNNTPITNNSCTSKGEIECQIKKIVIRNIAIRRSPLHRSRNR